MSDDNSNPIRGTAVRTLICIQRIGIRGVRPDGRDFRLRVFVIPNCPLEIGPTSRSVDVWINALLLISVVYHCVSLFSQDFLRIKNPLTL
jgi:hypothetical protein